MNETQLNLAQQLKDELDKDIQPKITVPNKLAELQAIASQTQQKSKMAQWQDLGGYTYQEIGIVKMAELYYSMSWGWTIPQAILMAKHCAQFDFKVTPEEGHVYFSAAGRITTSVEGLKIKAEFKGMKLGPPKWTNVERPWPKGLVKKSNKGVEYTAETDIGVKCEIAINGEPVEYTAWTSVWFMANNPNWADRTEHMLQTRALGNCIKFGTGIGISEELIDSPPTSEPVKQEVKAPKETPFVR